MKYYIWHNSSGLEKYFIKKMMEYVNINVENSECISLPLPNDVKSRPSQSEVIKKYSEYAQDSNGPASEATIIFYGECGKWLEAKYDNHPSVLMFNHDIESNASIPLENEYESECDIVNLIEYLKKDNSYKDLLTDDVLNGILINCSIEKDWRLIAANAHGGRPALARQLYKSNNMRTTSDIINIIKNYRHEYSLKNEYDCKYLKYDYVNTKKDKNVKAPFNVKIIKDILIGNVSEFKKLPIEDRINNIWSDDNEICIEKLNINYKYIAEDDLYDNYYKGLCGGDAEAQGEPGERRARNCLTKHLNYLFLFCENEEDPDTLCEIALSLGPGHREFVISLVDQVRDKYRQPYGMTCEAGGYETTNFRAACKDANALSELADYILNNLLGGNRPVSAWRSSFFCPLTVDEKVIDSLEKKLDEMASRVEQVLVGKQEYNYYLSHVREQLFPKKENGNSSHGIRSYWVKPQKKLELSITKHSSGNSVATELQCEISDILLHHLDKNVVLVEWQFSHGGPDVQNKTDGKLVTLEHTRYPAGSPPKPYWPELIKHKYKWSFNNLLDWNASACFLYSPFKDSDTEAHIDIKLIEYSNEEAKTKIGEVHYGTEIELRENPENWFKVFCERAFPGIFQPGAGETFRDKFLFDERAHVLSSVVLSGDMPQMPAAKDRFDALIVRLYDVSGSGTGFPYDKTFLGKEMPEALYERFRSDGSIYAATSHSFVYAGFGKFATEHIHSHHMQEMYRTLFIIMQLYRAILHQFEASLSRSLMDGSDRSGNRKIREEHERFLEFARTKWFPEVTLQEEGRELNVLLWKRARFSHIFEKINMLSKRIDDLNTLKLEEIAKKNKDRSDRIREALQNWLAPLATFAVVLTLTQGRTGLEGRTPLPSIFDQLHSRLSYWGMWGEFYIDFLLLMVVAGALRLILLCFKIVPWMGKYEPKRNNILNGLYFDYEKRCDYYSKYNDTNSKIRMWLVKMKLILLPNIILIIGTVSLAALLSLLF